MGNQWAVEHLRRHIHEDAPRHAYLICGPAGIGRRTLALRFAMALNCTQAAEKGDICGECRACVQLAKLGHPDLEVIQANQPAGQLKVDQIRELQHRLSLAPYEARYRIALLLNFERANPSAANALLKTLEEPPERVILLLTADSPDSLLPTIVSRCEVILLRPLETQVLAGLLQARLGIDTTQALIYAHLSNGCPGLALRLQSQPELMQDWNALLQEYVRLLSDTQIERFAAAEALAKEKDKQRLISTLSCWMSFWRDVILVQGGLKGKLTNVQFESQIQAVSSKVAWQEALSALKEIQKTLTLLDTNVNPRLALEVLLTNMPSLRN
ncbi:MAG: DNA polymerase III subunit delta' [Anaerolineales bacterium]